MEHRSGIDHRYFGIRYDRALATKCFLFDVIKKLINPGVFGGGKILFLIRN